MLRNNEMSMPLTLLLKSPVVRVVRRLPAVSGALRRDRFRGLRGLGLLGAGSVHMFARSSPRQTFFFPLVAFEPV